MNIESDIDTVLVKLAATLDKVRGWSDKINADIQKVDQEFLVKVIPGLEPIATVVAEISTGLTAMVDALDTIADGLAANGKTVNPANPLGVGGNQAP
jgi:hypothetical protein